MARRHPTNPPAARCHAKNTRGEPCKAYAIRGGVVCQAHGGAAPQVRAKADERLQEWRLKRAMQIDEGLNHIMEGADGKRLAALVAKNPGLLPRLLEVADRFRGGDQGPSDVDIRVTLSKRLTGGEE